jgi:hypothetical protein
MPYVELKEGPLEQFTHEMEPFLHKDGLLVRLNKGLWLQPPSTHIRESASKLVKKFSIVCAGVVELVADLVVCEEGKLFCQKLHKLW